MNVSWLPRDTTNICREFTTVTTCAPAFVAFMTLITKYFGNFVDDEVKFIFIFKTVCTIRK